MKTQIPVEIPSDLHPDTKSLVIRFAAALADKLHIAEKKYGYSDGWKTSGWVERGECAERLVAHVRKGDPRDVAAYCAFLWYHGASTALPATSVADQEKIAALEARVAEIDFLADATKISTPFRMLEQELELERRRRVLAETAVTCCHSAMLGKVNPKHPAWGVVFAVQDAAWKADSTQKPDSGDALTK